MEEGIVFIYFGHCGLCYRNPYKASFCLGEMSNKNMKFFGMKIEHGNFYFVSGSKEDAINHFIDQEKHDGGTRHIDYSTFRPVNMSEIERMFSLIPTEQKVSSDGVVELGYGNIGASKDLFSSDNTQNISPQYFKVNGIVPLYLAAKSEEAATAYLENSTPIPVEISEIEQIFSNIPTTPKVRSSGVVELGHGNMRMYNSSN